MDRYSATRLALHIGVLIMTAGPAQGQVRVGELLVTPVQDGVTVRLAREDRAGRSPGQPEDQLTAQGPGILPGEGPSPSQPHSQAYFPPHSQPLSQPQSQSQSQAQSQAYSQPQSQPQQSRQEPQPAQRPEPTYVELQLSQPEQQPPASPAETRITPAADSQPPARPVPRPLPPLPAPRSHALERDVLTVRAARAAMQLDDQQRGRKMAALR